MQKDEAEAQALKEQTVKELFDAVDNMDEESQDGKALIEHLHALGPASPAQITLTGPELNKMGRELDPTELGTFRYEGFFEWMLNPKNRIATKLLTAAAVEEEEEELSEKEKKKMKKMKSKDKSVDAEDEGTDGVDADMFSSPDHQEIWEQIDPDGIGYVIVDGFIETLSQTYGVKISKKEKDAAWEILDPEGIEDVFVDKYIEWIKSKDKAAQKILNRKSKMAKKEAKAKKHVVDPVAMRTERITTLFNALDKPGRGIIRVEDFPNLGDSVEVELSAAEMSRASRKLDPDETTEITFEAYEVWMMEPTNETVRKLFQPEVIELIEREIAEAEAEALALAEEEAGEGEGEEDGSAAVKLVVVQTGDLTEDEAKALFAMLDDAVTNELSHEDMLNMSEAIGFALSESSVEQAMLEISKFPRCVQ